MNFREIIRRYVVKVTFETLAVCLFGAWTKKFEEIFFNSIQFTFKDREDIYWYSTLYCNWTVMLNEDFLISFSYYFTFPFQYCV